MREAPPQPREPHRGVAEPSRLAQPCFDRIEHPGETTELLGRHALEVERVHENVPAAVDRADEVPAGISTPSRNVSQR